MPRRPREHQLEDESRVEFEAALGSRWLFRELGRDYGVDGEVEEFGTDDVATGLVYSVQLKATDQTDLKKALKLSIPNEHVDYYRSLQRPVLMVRYLACSKSLYVRWFHQYDRYVDGGGKKTITFRWRDSDVWAPGKDDELDEQARAFVRLMSSRVAFPLRVYVDARQAAIDRAEFTAALHALARPVADVVGLAYSAPRAADAVLTITDEEVRFDLQRVTSASLHFDKEVSAANVPGEVLAHDALTLVAMALERVGQSEKSSRVTGVAFPGSSLATDGDAAIALSGQMARARDIAGALRVYEALDSQGGDAEGNAAAFLMAVYTHAPTLSEQERQLLEQAVTRRIDRWRDSEPAKVAADTFNLANMKRGAGHVAEAGELLALARQFEPLYEQRQQWWMLKGLIALESGYSGQGAADLRAGLKLKESMLVRLQLAEALMKSGNYALAVDAIPDLERELEEPWVAELVVLRAVLRVIVDKLGVAEQDRDPTALADLDAEAQRRIPNGEIVGEDFLICILHRDALCSLAWELISSVDTTRTEEDSFDRRLVRAWLAQSDAQLWLDLVVDAINGYGQIELMPAMFVCGDVMTDERLLALAASTLTATPGDNGVEAPAEFIAGLLQAVEHSVLESRRRRSGAPDFRLLQSDEMLALPTSSAHVIGGCS
jgi:hypothetical protein